MGLDEDLAKVTPRPDGTGWRVKSTATHHIDVMPMLYNDRICTTPVDNEMVYDRYWCYDKGYALFAAIAWDGSNDTEPVGWKKAHDGRRSDAKG